MSVVWKYEVGPGLREIILPSGAQQRRRAMTERDRPAAAKECWCGKSPPCLEHASRNVSCPPFPDGQPWGRTAAAEEPR